MKNRLLTYLPSFLLITIAVYQIHLAHSVSLSPWKGGGFGMFSSTELGLVRYVRVFLAAPDRSEELELPESLRDLADRAATLPTDAQLEKLARRIAEREKKQRRPISQVRIEVWRNEYETASLAAVPRKIRDYEFQVE